MPKKMLLRIICQVLGEKDRLDLESGVLCEWVYENFMNKYGLKNVAEKKYGQMVASCFVYENQIPRIKMFGRLLDIHTQSENGPFEYNKYQELVETFVHQVLNFKVDDSEERLLVPIVIFIFYYQ